MLENTSYLHMIDKGLSKLQIHTHTNVWKAYSYRSAVLATVRSEPEIQKLE